MRTLILFYSRSGTTSAAAHVLAERLDADLGEITCDRYRWPVLGYARAGYDSLKRIVPPISIPSEQIESYDRLVVGTPIWTSYPATPMRAFLSENTEWPKHIALFVTFGGHSPPEKALAEMASMLPQKPEARLALHADDVKEGRIVERAANFIKARSNSEAAGVIPGAATSLPPAKSKPDLRKTGSHGPGPYPYGSV